MQEFIRQLLQEQGVSPDLDPEVREELTRQLTGRATDFVNKRLLDSMNDETVSHFNRLLDEHPDDAALMQDFIAVNVPDRERLVASALTEFRALYLGDKA